MIKLYEICPGKNVNCLKALMALGYLRIFKNTRIKNSVIILYHYSKTTRQNYLTQLAESEICLKKQKVFG